MYGFRSFSAWLCASAIFVSAAHTTHASAFGVELKPSTVEMTVKPGDLQRQIVTIKNINEANVIELTLSLADWSLDENGKLILDVPSSLERSATNWARVSSASLSLQAGASQDITIEIRPPYDVDNKGDYRFALLATTILPEINDEGHASGLWKRYQLTSLFHLTFKPSKSLPNVTSVAVNTKRPALITLQIENEGEAHARLGGTAFMKNMKGDVMSETRLNAVVLGNGKRVYDVQLKDTEDLASGKYTIDFDLNNTFVPQTKVRSVKVPVKRLEYEID